MLISHLCPAYQRLMNLMMMADGDTQEWMGMGLTVQARPIHGGEWRSPVRCGNMVYDDRLASGWRPSVIPAVPDCSLIILYLCRMEWQSLLCS
jgi:hypothetical protein